MIDTPSTTETEHRLPTAYSQGFAHVRIVTAINPDSTGPLGGPDPLDIPVAPEVALESRPRAALEDLLRAD
ncbi:hypothetical protein [Hyphomicrobium sp.]|uniref:hypothetical protein n=1 Tax=Hyphomicrobium sp. TaxID=82 RepID=UPI0025C2F1AB|nr:hypothetical protein [Hyphomicrobium sp.]MCC7250834.1 hypothetical protein [Hyphomicrobium sp.]